MPKPTQKQRPRHRLHSYEPIEVSLVDMGANQKVFLMHKSKHGAQTELVHRVQHPDAAARTVLDRLAQRMLKAAPRPPSRPPPPPDDAPMDDAPMDDSPDQVDDADAIFAGLSDQARAGLEACARILQPLAGEVTDAMVDAMLAQIGIAPDDAADEDDAAMMQDDADEDDAPLQKAAPKADPDNPDDDDNDDDNDADADAADYDPDDGIDNEADDAPAAVAKAKKAPLPFGKKGDAADDDEPDEEDDDAPDDAADDADAEPAKKGDMTKPKKNGYKFEKAHKDTRAMPEKTEPQPQSITKAHRELVQKFDSLVKENKSLRDEVATERDARMQREFVAKAAEVCEAGDPEALVQMLTATHKVQGDAGVEALMQVLKTAHTRIVEQRKMGGDLFGEIGSRIGDAHAGDAKTKADAVMKGLVEKSDGTRTEAQIRRDFWKSTQGRELRQQINREHAEGGR